MLKNAGFADAVHVGGGIVAWVKQIEPDKPADSAKRDSNRPPKFLRSRYGLDVRRQDTAGADRVGSQRIRKPPYSNS